MIIIYLKLFFRNVSTFAACLQWRLSLLKARHCRMLQSDWSERVDSFSISEFSTPKMNREEPERPTALSWSLKRNDWLYMTYTPYGDFRRSSCVIPVLFISFRSEIDCTRRGNDLLLARWKCRAIIESGTRRLLGGRRAPELIPGSWSWHSRREPRARVCRES